jgi:Asp-tRNA(Asn)/Glu-tRNA(Gln) amidotransferase A subunit family amidase
MIYGLADKLKPWNLQQGSNGSSAGSASATVAGLVPLPLVQNLRLYCSTFCGVWCNRVASTFGSVARTGGMNLAWTSDRIGPICRSAEDCAMVFASIHGSDTYDRASRTMPLTIRIRLNLKPKSGIC